MRGGAILGGFGVFLLKFGGNSSLMAPYCVIPRDYLSDTPLLRAMGFWGSQHAQLGAIAPPPFLSVSPLKHMRSRGAIPPPPPQKGYLSDTSALPYENKANGCDTPLCDTTSKGCCAISGGVSRTGPPRQLVPHVGSHQFRQLLRESLQELWLLHSRKRKSSKHKHIICCILVMRPQLAPFFVLKFARSRGFGARFLQPFPKSLVTVKYDSNTKWLLIAVNGR